MWRMTTKLGAAVQEFLVSGLIMRWWWVHRHKLGVVTPRKTTLLQPTPKGTPTMRTRHRSHHFLCEKVSGAEVTRLCF